MNAERTVSVNEECRYWLASVPEFSMRVLTNPKWIAVKAVLFLFLGLLAAVLLFAERPTVKDALLLILAIWAFCRFYFFAFYVVGRWVDPAFRFTGLLSLARYAIRRARPNR